jgi:hypothetical protein
VKGGTPKRGKNNSMWDVPDQAHPTYCCFRAIIDSKFDIEKEVKIACPQINYRAGPGALRKKYLLRIIGGIKDVSSTPLPTSVATMWSPA